MSLSVSILNFQIEAKTNRILPLKAIVSLWAQKIQDDCVCALKVISEIVNLLSHDASMGESCDG